MNKQVLLDNLRCIPDWPIKGVNFRDVTTLFKNPDALKEMNFTRTRVSRRLWALKAAAS